MLLLSATPVTPTSRTRCQPHPRSRERGPQPALRHEETAVAGKNECVRHHPRPDTEIKMRTALLFHSLCLSFALAQPAAAVECIRGPYLQDAVGDAITIRWELDRGRTLCG